jgi:hypothetical protein
VLVRNGLLFPLPPKVTSLPSELVIDLPSSLIVSGSRKRTSGSVFRGSWSDRGLGGRLGIGIGSSYIVDFCGIGVENADLVNGVFLGIELLRNRESVRTLLCDWGLNSWPWKAAPECKNMM